MLGTLSPRPRHDDRPDDTPRQFVFADGHGGVEKIRIDLEGPHLEHLRATLDTNPDARRVRPLPATPAGSAAPPETDAERTGPVPIVPAAGPVPGAPAPWRPAPPPPVPPAARPGTPPPIPPPGTARVTPVTPSRDPLVERTVVEGTVLDEQVDAPEPALPPGLDDLVPDLDDDLVPDLDGDLGDDAPRDPGPAGDDEWAEAWVMDEGPSTGDAVGELADDATVTTPGDRGPGGRRRGADGAPDTGGWVGAGRQGPGTPA